MKIVFMGTPEFAVGALEALLKAGHEVTAVVTQPDKAKGRSGKLQFSEVKECALKYQIPVLQPRRIKTPEAIEQLKAYPADIYIVAAFGQILSQEILDIPPYGCLNIHASLLPAYRGASPIQHVILNGEEKTGVTIMQMNAGLDTGDILYTKEVPILRTDDYESLTKKLTLTGAQAITEALVLLQEGKLIPKKQEEEKSSYASLISKEMGKVEFREPAMQIEQKVKALNPWPGVYTRYHGKQLKIKEAWYCDNSSPEYEEPKEAFPGAEEECGSIVALSKEAIFVKTGKGILKITALQLEGKKAMTAKEFLPGAHMQAGEILG